MDVNRSPNKFTFGGPHTLINAWSFLAPHQVRNLVRVALVVVKIHGNGPGDVRRCDRCDASAPAPAQFLRVFHCSF
jgi:hypothetical protein